MPTGGKTALTRRSFVKGAAALGAIGAAAGGMASASGWLAPTSAAAEPEEFSTYMIHQSHCGGNCSLECTVRDGRLCHIKPNEAREDKRFQVCCLKGLSEVQHVYSTERIQTPLRRVGERGEGKFEAISWDEAYATFKKELEKVWDKYGKESVFVYMSSEANKTNLWLTEILGATKESAWAGIDVGHGNGFDPAIGSSKDTSDYHPGNSGVGAGYGDITSDVRDLVNSKYILIVGHNFMETNLMQCARLSDAKEAGARIVCVDPHYCTTAQKAHEWVPIEPGTDAALYLGMIHVILRDALYDGDFMRERTSMPFLVDAETGKLLRAGEEWGTDKDGKPVDPGDFLVWDEAAGAAARHDAAVSPALEGAFEVDGKRCATVFTRFQEEQRAYDLDWAAGKCGIPADKIEEIAIDYATSGASALIMGYGGNDKMSNADVAGHSIAMLVALTGNIAKPGAMAGIPAEQSGTLNASLGSWKLPETMTAGKLAVPTWELYKGDQDLHAYIAVGDTMLMKFADMGKTLDWIKGLDFVCVFDIYHMTSCDYADLVFPLTTKFECEEEIAWARPRNGHVLLSKKVIDPLFEARSDFRVQHEIAAMFGVEDGLPATREEWVRAMVDGSTDPIVEGITVDTLLAHNGVQAVKGQDQILRNYVDRFGTPSEKMEVYYEKLAEFGQALPQYEDCVEIYADNPMKEKYPLQFVQVRCKFRIHNQFFDSEWINQYDQFFIEMNPVDMESRGLASGDEVKMFNDRGEMTAPVRASEAVRPGCARALEGVWDKFVKSGGFQYLTNDAMLDRSSSLKMNGVLPFNDTLVEVEKA